MTRSTPTAGPVVDLFGRVEHLIDRAAEHDAKALVHLYDLTSSRVLGLVSRVVGPGERAHEITLAVYQGVWEAADLPDRASLPWLLHLAHRRAVAANRAVPARDRAARAGSRAFPPDRQWLVGLDDDEREALGEVYLGGRTVEEADRRLGWAPGTAISTLHRAMLHLAELHHDPSLEPPVVPSARLAASTEVAV